MPHSDFHIFNTTTDDFEKKAIAVFNYQYRENIVYREFCDALKILPQNISSIKQIPFLPIQFFKTKEIISGNAKAQIIFESSGTTGSINSKHYVTESAIYEGSFLAAFNSFYGNIEDWCIIGLLPSYLERKNASLVYMVNCLVEKSKNKNSGFYLDETEKLFNCLQQNEKNKQPTLLIGVTYALLDFAEKYKMDLAYTTVMETGGMKGRRQEMTREEVQHQLIQQLGINEVHSEYGMTELLSQAYSKGKGIFHCPPWMKIMLRAEDDPFQLYTGADVINKYQSGVVNVIDLANINSCAFIATDDIGKLYPDESFEIIGRLDNSDTRGCGLMIL